MFTAGDVEIKLFRRLIVLIEAPANRTIGGRAREDEGLPQMIHRLKE